MTVARYVTIWCDGVAESGSDCGSEVFENDAASARREAKRGGWLVSLPGGRDLCPEHTGQRDQTDKWGEGYGRTSEQPATPPGSPS